jgi:hypothetical protein
VGVTAKGIEKISEEYANNKAWYYEQWFPKNKDTFQEI